MITPIVPIQMNPVGC